MQWTLLLLMAFDLQGHRGARGLLPENTIAGFERALALGVDTLELDCGLTRDGALVVLHDTHLGPDLARAGGAWLGEEVAVASLTLDEVRAYDVGRLNPARDYAGRFPEQQPVDGQRVPTLAEVLALSDAVRFNVETKVDPTRPDATRPPEDFAAAMAEAVGPALRARVTVQSFDWRTLKALPEGFQTACLSEPETVKPGSPWTADLDPAAHPSVPALVQAAGCDVWSPDHASLTADMIADAHARGLKVIPWTVNDPARAAVLKGWKVDGLITDYPDRIR
jgi:glycerophosphoryl diester phosphodiesterase